MTSCLRPD